jgi:phage recombination protein Bet
MSKKNALEKRKDAILAFDMVWKNPEKIKKLFAPDLTPDEFAFFMGLSKSVEANPFLHEIWAVKYDKTKPASTFLGRDYYRKIAQSQPDYDGHMSDAIYSNDKFIVKNGAPEHEYNMEDRGNLIGAYALVWIKGRTRPNFKRVKFSEYNKRQSTWTQIPETMICKVAEAQVLRMTWQNEYQGAYSDSEQGVIEASFEEIPPKTDKAQPEATGNGKPKLDYEGLNTMMLDKLCDIEKVRQYLKSKGLTNIEDANPMLYQLIFDEVAAM